MKNLTFHKLDTTDHLVYPEDYEDLNLSSSALEIFTDYSRNRPSVIDYSTSADEAERLMKTAHVKLKLVIDQDNELIGVISFADLSMQRIMPLVSQGAVRGDIRVKDLMTPKWSLQTLDYGELSEARIGDVVETLQKNGVQHCLVVDRATHAIRGLISASDMAQKLHLHIAITKAPSFADIFQAVRH